MSEYFNSIVDGMQSFFTGMKLTFDHFINKKEKVATLQYPHEKWPIPERNIGFNHSEYNLIRSRLHVDIDDCIACMQCEKACPVDCIKIDFIKPPKDNDFDCGMTSNDTQKKMIVSRFTIDMSECMYCNLCVYPCPEECIYMVGGPNENKHEIDYEFSQYKRDGMIFEFADAADEEILQAGGEKWLNDRDEKLKIYSEGRDLKGEVVKTEPIPVVMEQSIHQEQEDGSKKQDTPSKKSDVLDISSFNEISDKMSRGIAKKAFTAAKRNGQDAPSILSAVAQALSDYGKMTNDIQEILNLLSSPDIESKDLPESDLLGKSVTAPPVESSGTSKELDIKDLNDIEDKMTRGMAKKAFTAAKRSGEDKILAIRNALNDAGKLDETISALLDGFMSNDESSTSPTEDIKEGGGPSDNDSGKIAATAEKPLFDLANLNGIDDKMARGIAKKIYTSGKRAEKSSLDIIADIRNGLNEASKMNDDVEKILNDLEN